MMENTQQDDHEIIPVYMGIPKRLWRSLERRKKDEGYKSIQELIRVKMTQEQKQWEESKNTNNQK